MKTNIDNIIASSETSLQKRFNDIDEVSLFNTKKVLNAFQRHNVALRHFNGTSGYGYDDSGRDVLNEVFADVFGAEKAVVSPRITCGTHAICLSLFGLLKHGARAVAVNGVYDSLLGAISGKNGLVENGVTFDFIEPLSDGVDFDALDKYLSAHKTTMVYVQRSRGYTQRNALSLAQIAEISKFSKKRGAEMVFVDNCYGEFVEKQEPCDVGADVCAGSLIKNVGGGIAPTGGYFCGKADLVDKILAHFVTPTLMGEVGSYEGGYRLFYQGLFVAPHTTAQALKTAALFSQSLNTLGYDVLPLPNERWGDIIVSVTLNSPEKMTAFCQAVQFCSPVDSNASPTPWEMPGYADKVVMAAGCFVQGSSIELSCDGPFRQPYTVYLQGGLTYEHGKIACREVLERLCN